VTERRQKPSPLDLFVSSSPVQKPTVLQLASGTRRSLNQADPVTAARRRERFRPTEPNQVWDSVRAEPLYAEDRPRRGCLELGRTLHRMGVGGDVQRWDEEKPAVRGSRRVDGVRTCD
jgi:hypothetical protein